MKNKHLVSFLPCLFSRLVLFIVLIYKYTISPLLGSNCRFYPSCSSYIYEVFVRFPFKDALWYATKRLLKCHPFHQCGIDMVPNSNKKV